MDGGSARSSDSSGADKRKASSRFGIRAWIRPQSRRLRSTVRAITTALVVVLVVPMPASAAAGDLDLTFGGDGTVLTDFGRLDHAKAVGIQSDGKIVAAGRTGSNFAVARYEVNGDLDLTFGGGDGKVVTNLGAPSQPFFLVIQSDDKIVVGGGAGGNFAVVRYEPDGGHDSSFGTSGRVFTDFGGRDDQIRGLALQADGRIVAAGFTDASGSYDFALARYETDGSLDPTFGGAGTVVTDLGNTDQIKAVALQADGRIVAAGRTNVGRTFDFALARYETDGSLDPSFGGDGTVRTDFGKADMAKAMAIQTDGKIVAAGEGGNSFALARYEIDGTLDLTFGNDGRVITHFGQRDFVFGLQIQTDGRIVAAGYTNASGTYDFALARYETDGSLDPTFGDAGTILTDLGGDDQARSLILQADGKIVAAGLSSAAGSYDFAIVRYDAE